MIDIVVERESRWFVERGYCRGIKFVGLELGRIGALFAVSIVVEWLEFRLNTAMIGRVTPLERASSALYMLM